MDESVKIQKEITRVGETMSLEIQIVHTLRHMYNLVSHRFAA